MITEIVLEGFSLFAKKTQGSFLTLSTFTFRVFSRYFYPKRQSLMQIYSAESTMKVLHTHTYTYKRWSQRCKATTSSSRAGLGVLLRDTSTISYEEAGIEVVFSTGAQK